MLFSVGGGDAVAREGFEIPTHDHEEFVWAYGNVDQILYRRGGASGKVVATVTYTYDGSGNVLTASRSL